MKMILPLLFAPLFLWAGLVEWVSNGCPGDFANPPTEEDAHSVYFKQVQYRLAKQGWSIIIPEGMPGTRGDVVIFNNSPNHPDDFKHISAKKILITWEPPTYWPSNHDPNVLRYFDRIITWNTKLIDGKRYLQFWYPSCYPMSNNLPSWQERRLVCMVVGNKSSKHRFELYSERRRTISFYERHPELSFHLYGIGWDKYHLRCFVSAPPDKLEVVKNYRFSYAYENYFNDESYITEKIFDCFQAGTVPIYLGAKNITDFIPANCFINARNFQNLDSLHRFIETMDEATWTSYQNNIRAFLDSPKAHLFTNTTLADAIMQAIFN